MSECLVVLSDMANVLPELNSQKRLLQVGEQINADIALSLIICVNRTRFLQFLQQDYRIL